MRTNAKIFTSGCALMALLGGVLVPSVSLALHRESPPAVRLTNADTHAASTGRSWGNWVAFSSTQDLANLGAAREPGKQIFLWNQAFYDCAQGTTGDSASIFCPPAGTPWLIQVTNGAGNPDNPTVGTNPSDTPQDNVWVSFDADGRFNCGTNATCLASAQASRRQIFIKNVMTSELRQVTASGVGDSTNPSGNGQLGVIAFESTAPLAGFPNPAGVKQVFVYQRICNTGGAASCGVSAPVQISVGIAPDTTILGLGESSRPSVNESGTVVAFQSRADLISTGNDTGRSQIYLATYDKKNRRVTQLYRVTNGNASSTNPFLGERKEGSGSVQHVVAFESLATNLPGATGLSGSQIYEVALGEADNAPESEVRQLTTSTLFGSCHFPVTDATGNRAGFVCDGDPLQNGTTGNRAFVLDRVSQVLYQITGVGDVQGPVSLSVGQWFMTLSTTSDLTGGGTCGYQIYVVDYYTGKWQAATALGQVPGDTIGQGSSTAIGLRNFEMMPGNGLGSGSELVLTTKTGTVTTGITAPGRIGLTIGAPDDIWKEASVAVQANRVKLPSVPVPGYGAFCFEATGSGSGTVDCNGGKLGGSVSTAKDHVTNDTNTTCQAPGCRDTDASCNEGMTGSHLVSCPTCSGGTCAGGPNAGASCSNDATCQVGTQCTTCPFCDIPSGGVSGICAGGPQAGQVCSSNAFCQFGFSGLCNVEPVCMGPDEPQFTGTYAAGGMRVTLPVRLSISTSPGADDAWCTADDVKSPVQNVDFDLRLTTQSATGTVRDADPAPGQLGTTVTATNAGTAFACERLATGDLAGAELVGAVPLLNVQTLAGLQDMVVSFRLEPKPDTGSSCSPYCQTDSDCSDNDVCNGVETCSQNRCQPGTPLVCNDNDACNGVETCDAVNGCTAGTALDCNDNNVCTNDSCAAGSGCLHTANSNSCDDGNLCTVSDVCSGGQCGGTAKNCQNGTVCDGAEWCNQADGACMNGTALDCDDNNPCTADACDASGGCTHTPVSAGTSCSDNNLCTTGDQCDGAGACVGSAVSCPDGDGNVCNGYQVCNPGTGACQAAPAPNCDDGNSCTVDSCNSAIQNPAQACQHDTAALNGSSCSDGNACTGSGNTDTCQNGTCTGAAVNCVDANLCNGTETCNPASGCVAGTPVATDDNNPCTIDACVPATGAVTHTPDTGASCSDGSACTSGDTCTANGACIGTPISCSDNNACNGVESCNPASGCVNGTAPDIDDENDCTSDSCDPIQGVQHTPLNGGSCDDNDICTISDTCVQGTCEGAAKCDDGQACNGEETCNPINGTCGSGTAPNCDDNNVCTTDSCDDGTGCVNTPNTAACDDANACTTGDVCSGGVCGGATLNCSDNNICNGVETCDPQAGCVQAQAGENCDDGDVCTADTCDAVGGCSHDAVPDYAVCRANAFAAEVLNTPAEQLGGIHKKQKLVRMSSAAVKLLQKALVANPQQANVNLKNALTRLRKATRLLQRFMDQGFISTTVGNDLLALARGAAQAIEGSNI